MTRSSDRIAVFIDGANLYSSAKTLGFDIDYKRLLEEFQGRGTVVRAFYYIAVHESQEYSSIRPLIDWLDYNGYTVVTKPAKEFVDAGGRRKVKSSMDVELAVDAMELAGRVDQVVLFSGDGDFSSSGRSPAAPRGPRHRDLDHLKPPADARRRTAASGRRVHRSHGTPIKVWPRSAGCSVSALTTDRSASVSFEVDRNSIAGGEARSRAWTH
jgi:hypothetical protein